MSVELDAEVAAAAAAGRRGARVGVASVLLTTFLVCSLLVPARLVVGPPGSGLRPAQVVGLACLLWWVLSRALGTVHGAARGRAVRVAVGAFAATILVSYVMSSVLVVAPIEVAGADRGVVSLAGWVGVAMVTADLVPDRPTLERLLDRFVALTAVVAVIGVAQFMTGWDPAALIQFPGLNATAELVFIDESALLRRVAGTANHPIEFGVVLALSLPFALIRAMRPGDQRGMWLLATVLIGSALPMSLSRSGILAAVVALLVMASVWTARQRLAVGVALVVIVSGLRVVVPGLVGTITSLFAGVGTDPSVQGRTDDYAVVGGFIRSSPWAGRGFGTFLPDEYFFVDNQYIGSLIETGALGLAAVVGLLVVPAIAARATDRARRTIDGRRDETARALMAVMLASAAAFATFDALGFPMYSGVFFFLVGSVATVRRCPLPSLFGSEGTEVAA